MDKLKRIIGMIPIWSRVVLCLFPLSVLLHISFILFGGFAEAYRRTAGAFFRTVLAYITSPFPMSVAEALIISVPFLFVAITVKILRSDSNSADTVRILSGLLAVVTLMYTTFVATFAAGFYGRQIGEYFGLERRDITVDELYEAAVITVQGANEAYAEIEGKSPASTTMGMDMDELSSKLLDGFDALHETYGFPSKLTARIKPVVLSGPMTYTHVSGVYTYFTGEANINVNYPDFVIPYTAAHEMSHQRGVSREDEANFTAFLVCIDSADPYIRYSGYLNMYQYMASALAYASYEKYAEVTKLLSDGIKTELNAYSAFFDKYRDNAAAKISDTVNDSYLNLMSGTDSRSYGMVVDLATLYLLGF